MFVMVPGHYVCNMVPGSRMKRFLYIEFTLLEHVLVTLGEGICSVLIL